MAFTHVRFRNSPQSYGMGCGCGCGCGGCRGCGCGCGGERGNFGAAGGSFLGVWKVPVWTFNDKKYGTCPGWAKNYDEWKTVVAEFKKLPNKAGFYTGDEANELGNKARDLERAGEGAWELCKSKKGQIDTTQFETGESAGSDNTILYAIGGLGAVAVIAGTAIFIRRRRAAAAAASAVKA